ncbi:MAG TPA: response regulator transcription factor [Ohtaekwangia sp.]|uniref:response regulator transcription factor n=1 Tax=Ohtaekwangia sp. TaxID=2066019 RepID=UPI002F93C6BC
MVKVVVVDDHALSRIGFIALLKSDPRFEIVGEYKNFNLIKPHVPTLNTQLLFIDISLNKQSGLDVASYIKSNNPSVKVVILTSLSEECYIMSAVESDIDGYIHKDSEPSEMLMGIDRILEGEKFYSLEISNRLISNLHRKNFRGLPFLTSKEKEIIRYLMEGNSTKEIAALLEVSPRTIDTHRANILGKFNLKNTNELITKIAEQKIRI